MRSMIVSGKYLVADADTVVPNGAVYVEDGRVVEVGPAAGIAVRRKADETLGGEDCLVVPGFVNAHGHGKGITDFQRGAGDDTLEVWKFRGFPPIDLRWDTLYQCTLLVEAGVTTTMHNHAPARPEEAVEEFARILDAYEESGMGAAFAPALSYRNPFVYGDNDAFVASLGTEARRTAEAIRDAGARFGPEAYFAAVKALSTRRNHPLVAVHHGPMAPQWVDEDAFAEIKRRASSEGRMFFTHVQQTPHQYLYGIKTYGKTLVRRMADTGLLDPGTVLGHCVWIDEGDLEAIAASGCAVTHHPSCNLRVRNGIAPVAAMSAAGIPVGIGMDDKEMGDDRDYLGEIRVASRLHRLTGFRPGSPCLGARDFFRMATEGGARCLGLEGEIGALRQGMRADLAILDWKGLTEPFTWDGHDPLDVLLQRGSSRHVRSTIVNGRVLYREGRHLVMNREEIVARLRESIPADYAGRYEASRKSLAPLKEAIADWFEPWGRELEKLGSSPNRPPLG